MSGLKSKRKPNFRVSTVLTPSQIASLFRFLFFDAYPVSVAAKYLRIDNKDLLDFLETEHGKTFFTTFHEEKGAFWWVRSNTLNLIYTRAKLRPISVERAKCIRRVQAVQDFGHFNKKTKKYVWHNKVYSRNKLDFMKYLDRVSNLSLLFVKKVEKRSDILAPALTVSYSTRFTDKLRMQNSRITYFNLWKDAAEYHSKACFVTLTLDPKNFDNLWDANKDVMNAYHDLNDFINKRIKAEIKRYPEFKYMYKAVKHGCIVDSEFLSGNNNSRFRLLFQQYNRLFPDYLYKDFKLEVETGQFDQETLKNLIKQGYEISSHYKDLPENYKLQILNVAEFQFNGRLHLHFVVFGMDYLIDLRELRQWWKNKKMGEMVHAYGLKKDVKKPLEWTWKNPSNRPKDHRNKGPLDYLKTYLMKAQYGTSVNYWTFNNRFYTHSRNFGSYREQFLKALIANRRKNKPSVYAFVKSINSHGVDPNTRYVNNEEYVNLCKSLLLTATD